MKFYIILIYKIFGLSSCLDILADGNSDLFEPSCLFNPFKFF